MSIASLYPSINPSLLLDFANNKVLDPRITFTRTTTATYYDGVTTAKAEENMLLYSQQFDNAYWTPSNTTVTADTTTAPDGTSTADKLSMTTQTNYFSLGVGSSSQFSYVGGQTYTLSVYMKSAPNQFGFIGYYDNTFRTATFDLTNGTANASSGVGSVSITSVGNGWYRCVFTFTPVVTVGSFAYFGVANGSSYQFPGTFAGTAGNGIFIWGAQLEQRSSATAYTATTTQAITNYIPVLQTAAAGQARFDHNPTTGESLGLLIEEARTNSLTYSAQFDNAAWTKSNATITANTIVAPDGTLTGDKFVEGSGASQLPQVTASTSISASTAFTLSIYAKAAERNWLVVNANDGNQSNRTWFNLSTGVVGTNAAGTTATITPVGNGWYRCTASRTTQSTVPNTPAQVFQVADADGSNIYTGNGFSGLFIWGAQLEISGSFATSYIPTVASSVTRNADAASMTGTNFSSWFNAGEGTFYGEANLSGGGRYFHTAKTGSNAQIEGSQQTAYFEAFVYTTDTQAQINITAASFINRRVALAYQVNNIAACVSGGAVSVDTNAILPLDLNAFYVNSYGTSGPLGSGTFKKVAYYPKRLTNAQLQALTV